MKGEHINVLMAASMLRNYHKTDIYDQMPQNVQAEVFKEINSGI